MKDWGHHIELIDRVPAPDSFVDDFVSYFSFAALAFVRQGRRRFGSSFDSSKLDALTHGLAESGSKNIRRVPAALGRLALVRWHSQRFYQNYDVLLTPTLARPPVPVGELDPARSDFETLLARLISWVAYTPFQNVTGEPSLSLPTGRSVTGAPIGTLFSAAKGHDARLLHLAYELNETQRWRRIGLSS